MTHRLASLPQMGLLGKTIFGSEAFFAYVILAKRLAAKLRAIRRWDRRAFAETESLLQN